MSWKKNLKKMKIKKLWLERTISLVKKLKPRSVRTLHLIKKDLISHKLELKIVLGIFLYLFIPELHLFMNKMEPLKIDLFLLFDTKQDIQWYVKDTLDIISNIIMFSVILLVLPKYLKCFGWALVATNILRLVTYWLFYAQFELPYYIILFSATIIIWLYDVYTKK